MSARDRLTPLERAVIDALAWDLREVAPDLGGQVEESLPGQRRNTGQGAFTELIVARDRPVPTSGPTGLFGTVHAMVGDLADAVAFQVELRQGRLLALHADSYDQDTRGIDFATVTFKDVFYLDDTGASVLYDPTQTMPDSPLLALQRHDDPPLPTYDVAPDSPPLDPQIERAIERIRGIKSPTVTPADTGSAPVLRVSASLRRIIAVAYWLTAALFGLAWVRAWEPVSELWGWFGIEDAVPYLILPLLLIGFIYKLTREPKPTRQR